MIKLLRELSSTLTTVFDKVIVDARIVDSMSRLPREMSVQSQSSKPDELSVHHQTKESSQEVMKNESTLKITLQAHKDHLLVKQRSKSHLSEISNEPITPSLRSRTTTIGGDTPTTSVQTNCPTLTAYGSLASINRPPKTTNIRAKPSFRRVLLFISINPNLEAVLNERKMNILQ